MKRKLHKQRGRGLLLGIDCQPLAGKHQSTLVSPAGAFHRDLGPEGEDHVGRAHAHLLHVLSRLLEVVDVRHDDVVRLDTQVLQQAHHVQRTEEGRERVLPVDTLAPLTSIVLAQGIGHLTPGLVPPVRQSCADLGCPRSSVVGLLLLLATGELRDLLQDKRLDVLSHGEDTVSPALAVLGVGAVGDGVEVGELLQLLLELFEARLDHILGFGSESVEAVTPRTGDDPMRLSLAVPAHCGGATSRSAVGRARCVLLEVAGVQENNGTVGRIFDHLAEITLASGRVEDHREGIVGHFFSLTTLASYCL